MKTIYRIFTIIMIIAVGAGVGLLIGVLLTNDQTVRRVELESEGDTVRDLAFSAEDFLPGDVKEYTLLVRGDAGGNFDMSFTCENVGEGKLWQYLDMEISYGSVKKEVAFAELFEGTELHFDVELEDGDTAEFAVRYKMPIETGNEAERQTADFILRLSAQRA